MTRPPPTSTLFPTRRSSDLSNPFPSFITPNSPTNWNAFGIVSVFASERPNGSRSEEHTSELQSHSDLVCRLLLEKKKKKQHLQSSREEIYQIHTMSIRIR